jgi:hypothetical protein
VTIFARIPAPRAGEAPTTNGASPQAIPPACGLGANPSTCHGCGAALPPNARKWCSERCRKGKYARPCVDCGKPMNGSDGHGPGAPVRCAVCEAVRARTDARRRHVDAFHRFHAQHGRVPSAWEWRGGTWPSSSAVIRAFGSWNAGVRAAGFEPRRSGERGPQRGATS